MKLKKRKYWSYRLHSQFSDSFDLALPAPANLICRSASSIRRGSVFEDTSAWTISSLTDGGTAVLARLITRCISRLTLKATKRKSLARSGLPAPWKTFRRRLSQVPSSAFGSALASYTAKVSGSFYQVKIQRLIIPIWWVIMQAIALIWALRQVLTWWWSRPNAKFAGVSVDKFWIWWIIQRFTGT